MPIIADTLLESLTLLKNANLVFRQHCISEFITNEAVCKRNVENSTSTITALIPIIGYVKASLIAKMAKDESLSIKDAAIKSSFISKKKYNEIISPEAVCRLAK